MKFDLDPQMSQEEQVIAAGADLGMTAQQAVRNGRIASNKIKAVVILDGYLRFLHSKPRNALSSEATILIRQKLEGTNLALACLRCSPELAVLATDRRNYLEYVQKCRVKTELGLEDVLGMSLQLLVELRGMSD